MSAEIDPELSVLEESYHAITDRHAFDRLMVAWNRMLGSSPKIHETDRMRHHFSSIFGLLEDPRALEAEEHITASLRRLRMPAMLLNAEGVVVSSNPQMQAAWGLTSGSAFTPQFLDERSADEYAALLRAANTLSNRHAALVRMAGPDGAAINAMLTVEVFHEAGIPLLRLEVLAHDFTAQTRSMLSRSFALSPGEIEVCEAFLRTPSISDIADARATSPATVKRQLSQIFEKIGVSRQTDLVALLAGLTQFDTVTAAQLVPEWSDPYGAQQFVDDGGIPLTYTWTGAEAGRPVIFVHGPLTGYAMQQPACDLLRERGIKLISVIRPGFGNSAPPASDDACAEGSAAIGRVMNHLGIRRCPMVGAVSGLVPIMRFADDHPDRVGPVASIGAYLPLGRRAARKHLAFNHRVFFELVLRAPRAAEYMGRLAWRNARDLGAEFVWGKIYEQSPVDRQTMLSARVMPYSIAAIAMTMCHGHRTFTMDQPMQVHDWAPYLARLQQPLRMLCGAQDHNAPPALVRDLVAAHPVAQAEFIADAGQTVLHSHPVDAARFIADLANLADLAEGNDAA